jgi:hypothetical protein
MVRARRARLERSRCKTPSSFRNRVIGIALWTSLAACAGHSDAIERGQRYYEDNQYERALALWRDLDRRDATLPPAERARFAYFRGMTDYRLGFRDDARHWLAIAKARDVDGSAGLGATWRERLDGALADLDRETFGIRSDGSDVIQTIEAPPDTAFPDGLPTDAGTSTEPLGR